MAAVSGREAPAFDVLRGGQPRRGRGHPRPRHTRRLAGAGPPRSGTPGRPGRPLPAAHSCPPPHVRHHPSLARLPRSPRPTARRVFARSGLTVWPPPFPRTGGGPEGISTLHERGAPVRATGHATAGQRRAMRDPDRGGKAGRRRTLRSNPSRRRPGNTDEATRVRRPAERRARQAGRRKARFACVGPWTGAGNAASGATRVRHASSGHPGTVERTGEAVTTRGDGLPRWSPPGVRPQGRRPRLRAGAPPPTL